MPLWNGLRRRLSLQQLLLYLVDEDYTSTRQRSSREEYRDTDNDLDSDSLMRMGLMHSASADQGQETEVPREPAMPVLCNVFDPDEPVPLYELSQEHHRSRSDIRVPESDNLRREPREPLSLECAPPEPMGILDPSLALVNSNTSSGSTLSNGATLLSNGTRLNRRGREARESREHSREPQPRKRSLKNLGLKFLNARHRVP